MTPSGLFGSLGPSLLAFTLHRPWSIGMNLSLNLHHAPSTAMSHPSPAHHKPRATSYATVLSITHHTKGTNLPWFLNLVGDHLKKVLLHHCVLHPHLLGMQDCRHCGGESEIRARGEFPGKRKALIKLWLK